MSRDTARIVVSSAAAVAALAAPGVLSLLTDAPFLFASLGPTALSMARSPEDPASGPCSAFAAHTIGYLSAVSVVAALGLSTTPSVFDLQRIGWLRVLAALLALGLTTALEIALRVEHPPAGSTTLLVALGSFHPTWHDTVLVLGGVTAVSLCGGAVRRLRVRYGAAA